jgi:anaerobic selenocysteine-containing dehydrogenase
MLPDQPQSVSRRNFVKTSAAVSAAAMFSSLGSNFAHAQGSDQIKVAADAAMGR